MKNNLYTRVNLNFFYSLMFKVIDLYKFLSQQLNNFINTLIKKSLKNLFIQNEFYAFLQNFCYINHQ